MKINRYSAVNIHENRLYSDFDNIKYKQVIFIFLSGLGPPSEPGKPYLVVASPAEEPDVITVKWKPPTDDGGSKITGKINVRDFNYV